MHHHCCKRDANNGRASFPVARITCRISETGVAVPPTKLTGMFKPLCGHENTSHQEPR